MSAEIPGPQELNDEYNAQMEADSKASLERQRKDLEAQEAEKVKEEQRQANIKKQLQGDAKRDASK